MKEIQEMVNGFYNFREHPEVDCFQNLIFLLFDLNKLNVSNAWAIWPWEFQTKRHLVPNVFDDWLDIELTDPMSAERLLNLFSVGCTFKKNKYYEDLIGDFLNYLQNGIPVLIALDQYYVPYHYPHIYQKQHGLHTMLLCNLSKLQNEVYCVSAIPPFNGKIKLSEFYNALTSDYIHPWYVVLSFDMCKNPNRYDIWKKFKNDLYIVSNNLDTMESNVTVFYSSQILSIVKNIATFPVDTMQQKLIKFCSGVWGWHISRRGRLLTEFLQQSQCYIHPVLLNKSIQLVQEISRDWELAFRILFKAVTMKTHQFPLKSLFILSNIVQNEKKLCSVFLSESYLIKPWKID